MVWFLLPSLPSLRGCRDHNTRLQFHPSNDDLLLVAYTKTLPFIVSISTRHKRVMSSDVLQKQVDDRRVLCDAVWANQGKHVMIAYGKSNLALLSTSTLKPVVEKILKAGLLSPPRLEPSRQPRWVLVTSRAGIHVYDTTNLCCVDSGYREGVDNTPLSLCTLSHDNATVVAAPGSTDHGSTHNNCLFFFQTGVPGDIRLAQLPDMKDRLVAIKWHPSQPVLVACMSSGGVFMLHRPYTNNWPVGVAAHVGIGLLRPHLFAVSHSAFCLTPTQGIMYPNGYRILLENRMYKEREDEFDDMDEHGEPLPKRQRPFDESSAVDIVAPVPRVPEPRGSEGGGPNTAGIEDGDDERARSRHAWFNCVVSESNKGSGPPRVLPTRSTDEEGGSGRLMWLLPEVCVRAASKKKRARSLVWPVRTKSSF